ncbi:MAG: hypothetical protein CMO74_06550 [Verrucomicrobiales bacterium]|nr:hypothetical protein [Verrucomicrobiales bacterium]
MAKSLKTSLRNTLGALALALAAPLSGAEKAGEDWWSLQPIKRPEVPLVPNAAWARNSIDAFVLSRLTANKLSPSQEADRRTLIRRLSYDLTGLPPSPKEMEAFVNDQAPDAYEKVVNRLLASPHYGERWARHWLDVVHYGESHGFEYNQPRNHSWPYRNWVIRALNDDLPYDRFVQMQIAGDVIAPGSADGLIAIACLVTGPHNTTRPNNDTMRKTMRQDEVEDLVGMVGQTFLGLTVNCARCHDHKFDPISQKDYYALAAALSGVNPGERDLKGMVRGGDAAALQKLRELEVDWQKQIAAIEGPVRQQLLKEAQKAGAKDMPPQPTAAWNFAAGLADANGKRPVTLKGTAKQTPEGLMLDGRGWAVTAPLPYAVAEKTLEVWVKLKDLNQRGGGAITLQDNRGIVFNSIVYGEREPKRWMAGSNGFVRTKSFAGSEETEAAKQPVHFAIVYRADGSITGYRNGKPYGKAYNTGFHRFPENGAHLAFGIRHGTGAGANRMLNGTITGARFYNRALTANEVAASAGVGTITITEAQLAKALTPNQRERRRQATTQLGGVRKEIQTLLAKGPQAARVYTVIPRNPGVTQVLDRGSVLKPIGAVAPAGIPALKTVKADFGLANNAPDPQRRAKLAEWITHSDNPLFGRVIANRVWHYHFGAGLVNTPNDFGFSGTAPSHPALLDHLALYLADQKWSLKALHRYIVTSATYRQSSRLNPAAMKVDAGNRFLWRMSPRRMAAEEMRDTMLAASGKLNRELGGVGYRDVRAYSFKGSNFYDIIAQDKPEQFRRTIYRFSPRGARRNLLDTFDCPDASALAPDRASTTTPLQSLALMNNRFVLRQSDFFAERLKAEAGESITAQLRLAHQLTLSRAVNDRELTLAETFVKAHGMAAYCRVLLNTNAFLYVR